MCPTPGDLDKRSRSTAKTVHTRLDCRRHQGWARLGGGLPVTNLGKAKRGIRTRTTRPQSGCGKCLTLSSTDTQVKTRPRPQAKLWRGIPRCDDVVRQTARPSTPRGHLPVEQLDNNTEECPDVPTPDDGCGPRTRTRGSHTVRVLKNPFDPVIVLAELNAIDYKKLVLGSNLPDDHETFVAVDRWLRVLDRHPLTPVEAKRTGRAGRRRLDPWLVEAADRHPWWRITAVRIDHATHEPEPDPDNTGMYRSVVFWSPVPPPPIYVALLDIVSAGALSKRLDGGPTP